MAEAAFPRPSAVPACQAEWELFGILMICGQAPEGQWRRACVHEHIRDGFLCGEHVSLPEIAYCKTCHEIDGHHCPLTLARIGDAAPEASRA